MSTAAMKRVVYVSTCAFEVTDEDVAALAEDASRRNDALDLTGLMAFNGLNFIQAIEGESEAIDRVYASIQRDRRHHGVITLIEEPCDERLFPDWRMRYVRAPAAPLFNGQVRLGAEDVEDCAHVAQLFSGFLRFSQGGAT